MKLLREQELDSWLLDPVTEAPLSDFQRAVCGVAFRVPPPAVRHPARNAVFHMRRAWLIRHIDPEMATFRAITAEEEAATAIFHALKQRRYSGSEKLQLRSHPQKAALAPFAEAVWNGVATATNQQLSGGVEFRQDTGTLALWILGVDPAGQPAHLYPDPPLGFNIHNYGLLYDFSRELRAIEEREGQSMLHYIKERANRRNRSLYASEQGVPQFAGNIDGFLGSVQRIVIRHLTLLLLIAQEPRQQEFVQQALDSFLRIFRRVEKSIDLESERNR